MQHSTFVICCISVKSSFSLRQNQQIYVDWVIGQRFTVSKSVCSLNVATVLKGYGNMHSGLEICLGVPRLCLTIAGIGSSNCEAERLLSEFKGWMDG